jgi:prephenate dehydrogenase
MSSQLPNLKQSTTSIVGFGPFGQLLAHVLESFGFQSVVAVDPNDSQFEGAKTTRVNLEMAGKADLIWIAVPFSDFEIVCQQLAPIVQPGATIIDVLSVKERPSEIMLRTFSEDVGLIASHPLFGPQSTGGDLKSRQWVFHELRQTPWTKTLTSIIDEKGGEVVEISPMEHDRQMATIQGLTFFIGRSLLELGVSEASLTTGYYKKLLALAEQEKQHSDALFLTVESANPYASEVRKRFLDQAQQIHDRL